MKNYVFSPKMDKLPKEIIHYIFDYLEFYPRIRLSSTCRFMREQWYKHDHNEIFDINYVDHKHTIKAIQTIGKYVKCYIRSWNEFNTYDLSLYKNAYTLDLSYSRIYDVSLLNNVHTLIVTGTNIDDISMLNNVQILNITGCKHIANIPKLKNLRRLIMRFTNITDLSNLDGLNLLDISYTNVSDISMLKNVKTLYMKNCPNISQSQISEMKKYVKNLYIDKYWISSS